MCILIREKLNRSIIHGRSYYYDWYDVNEITFLLWNHRKWISYSHMYKKKMFTLCFDSVGIQNSLKLCPHPNSQEKEARGGDLSLRWKKIEFMDTSLNPSDIRGPKHNKFDAKYFHSRKSFRSSFPGQRDISYKKICNI